MTKNLSDSECFALLSNRQRLFFLQILEESCAESLPTKELAERIAERTYEETSAEVLREIRLILYHNHIPRLEAADVISHNRDDDTVKIHTNFDDLVPFLEQMKG